MEGFTEVEIKNTKKLLMEAANCGFCPYAMMIYHINHMHTTPSMPDKRVLR